MSKANDIPNRGDRLENEVIDIKVAVSALISTTELHQRNIEIQHRNIDAMLKLMAQSLQRMEVRESDNN